METTITETHYTMTKSPALRSDDRRWAALAARDERSAGAFIYAVATTGVFCRPECRSRLPRRENVRFFGDAASARSAGFRPCLRCRPEGAPSGAGRARLVEAACRKLESAEEVPSLAALAREAGLSPWHFHRVFKAAVGVTPKQYAAARRECRFRSGLEAGRPVTDSIYDAGYGSSSRAYEGAAKRLGMTPSAYKNGAAGEEIRYAFAPSPLGRILVAATARGVCAVEFAEGGGGIPERIRRRFPKAAFREADKEMAAWLKGVVALAETPGRRMADLPLDVRGTAFQERVWRALKEIPSGATRSYADIARRLGRPRSVRAVAGACASNPAALVIPCHRAVGSDGSLRGYRWGVSRKRALLDREAGARNYRRDVRAAPTRRMVSSVKSSSTFGKKTRSSKRT